MVWGMPRGGHPRDVCQRAPGPPSSTCRRTYQDELFSVVTTTNPLLQWCAMSASVALYTMWRLMDCQAPVQPSLAVGAFSRLLRSMDLEVYASGFGGMSPNGRNLLNNSAQCPGLFNNLHAVVCRVLVRVEDVVFLGYGTPCLGPGRKQSLICAPCCAWRPAIPAR